MIHYGLYLIIKNACIVGEWYKAGNISKLPTPIQDIYPRVTSDISQKDHEPCRTLRQTQDLIDAYHVDNKVTRTPQTCILIYCNSTYFGFVRNEIHLYEESGNIYIYTYYIYNIM